MVRYCLMTALLAAPFAAFAGNDSPEDRLVHEHRRFAGSKDNAESLVSGLRNDSTVHLTTRSGSTTSFTPATGKMGWGNVDIALSLAKATLADHGIRNPSPDEIKAALNGGTLTTKSGERVSLQGILKQRASGMGWGQIAQANGFKLGEVMRDRHHHRRDKHDDRKHADRKQDHKRADWKPDRGDLHRARFERPEHPHKFDRPERPERPQRPERPERPHRR